MDLGADRLPFHAPPRRIEAVRLHCAILALGCRSLAGFGAWLAGPKLPSEGRCGAYTFSPPNLSVPPSVPNRPTIRPIRPRIPFSDLTLSLNRVALTIIPKVCWKSVERDPRKRLSKRYLQTTNALTQIFERSASFALASNSNPRCSRTRWAALAKECS